MNSSGGSGSCRRLDARMRRLKIPATRGPGNRNQASGQLAATSSLFVGGARSHVWLHASRAPLGPEIATLCQGTPPLGSWASVSGPPPVQAPMTSLRHSTFYRELGGGAVFTIPGRKAGALKGSGVENIGDAQSRSNRQPYAYAWYYGPCSARRRQGKTIPLVIFRARSSGG
jgi:hypothetical protein